VGKDRSDITCLLYSVDVMPMELKQLEEALLESLKVALRVRYHESLPTNRCTRGSYGVLFCEVAKLLPLRIAHPRIDAMYTFHAIVWLVKCIKLKA
jgi:hypothetical protein